MSLQPDVVKRLHTTKHAQPIRNFDLFSKENNIRRSTMKYSPRNALRLSPMNTRDLKHDESFFGHITEQMSHQEPKTAQLKTKRALSPTP